MVELSAELWIGIVGIAISVAGAQLAFVIRQTSYIASMRAELCYFRDWARVHEQETKEDQQKLAELDKRLTMVEFNNSHSSSAGSVQS